MLITPDMILHDIERAFFRLEAHELTEDERERLTEILGKYFVLALKEG